MTLLLARRLARADLEVIARDNGSWDVALIIDGRYTRHYEGDPADTLAFWRDMLVEFTAHLEEGRDS